MYYIVVNIGDDEQSDWFGEAGAVGGGGAKSWWEDSDRDEDMEPSFQAILTGSLDHISDRAKQTYRMLADGMVSRNLDCGDISYHLLLVNS